MVMILHEISFFLQEYQILDDLDFESVRYVKPKPLTLRQMRLAKRDINSTGFILSSDPHHNWSISAEKNGQGLVASIKNHLGI